MDGARRRLEPRHAATLNQYRRKHRLKWTDVARLAGMTPQNLLRIRNGEISVSEDAAEGIDEAFNWILGEGIDAILSDKEPTERPRRVDVDPLRDETEREMWKVGNDAKLPEERIWWHIDNRRERLATEAGEAARRGRGKNSA